MEIKYLKRMFEHPKVKPPGTDFTYVLKGISEDSITFLENKYNGGHKLPVVLRELLFLAGEYCYIMDYNIFDSQDEMQSQAREYLAESGHSINAPFFVVDAYNVDDQFLFVYTNEGDNNPYVYEAFFEDEGVKFIKKLKYKLSEFLDARLDRLLVGRNPY